MKKIFVISFLLGVLIPTLSFAQGTPEVNIFTNPGDVKLNIDGSVTDSFNNTFGGTGGGNNGNTTCPKPQNIGELFEFAICLMSYNVIPFLISLGLIMFLVGMVKFISAGDNEEKREGGRGLMIFGIIALFVMISVWGLVRILHNTFFDSDQRFETPTLPKRSTTPFK